MPSLTDLGWNDAFASAFSRLAPDGALPARVIEAGRIAISRNAPEAKTWIRVFPHKSVSKKPAETRQGTGKGDVEFWCAVVKPGTILYEIDGVTEEAAKTAFNRVAHKLPIKVRLVRRRHA